MLLLIVKCVCVCICSHAQDSKMFIIIYMQKTEFMNSFILNIYILTQFYHKIVFNKEMYLNEIQSCWKCGKKNVFTFKAKFIFKINIFLFFNCL